MLYEVITGQAQVREQRAREHETDGQAGRLQEGPLTERGRAGQERRGDRRVLAVGLERRDREGVPYPRASYNFV